MNSIDKGRRIAEAQRLTFEKRKRQVCRVFELKVDRSNLTKEQKETLNMMFVESKWCYNYLLNKMNNEGLNIFEFKPKNLIDITHKDKNKNDVEVHLRYIGSSMKLALVEGMRSSIKSLSSRRKKGYKIGSLRFKSEYNSIELKQYGIVYRIEPNRKIKIQGIKKPLTVRGLNQIEKYGKSYDIANAKLIRRDDDYYINITIYFNKNEDETDKKEYKNKQIGIDFGCQTALILSDGTKIDVVVEESDRLKKLMKKLHKQKKGSNNRYRTIKKMHKEYNKATRRKNDAANKIVHKLLEENKQIIIQDEQIHAWHVKHGKKIQHSILGRIKERLNRYHDRVVVLNRFVPTTKFCHDCGHVHNDIKLWDRTFTCPSCGVVYDRDIHAAQNMVWIYNNIKIGLGESEFKREEFDEDVRRFFGWDSRTLIHEDAKSLA